MIDEYVNNELDFKKLLLEFTCSRTKKTEKELSHLDFLNVFFSEKNKEFKVVDYGFSDYMLIRDHFFVFESAGGLFFKVAFFESFSNVNCESNLNVEQVFPVKTVKYLTKGELKIEN